MNEQDYDMIADIVLEIATDAENYMTFRAIATPVLTEFGLTIEGINEDSDERKKCGDIEWEKKP